MPGTDEKAYRERLIKNGPGLIQKMVDMLETRQIPSYEELKKRYPTLSDLKLRNAAYIQDCNDIAK